MASEQAFADRQGETLVKPPGSIAGESFALRNLELLLQGAAALDKAAATQLVSPNDTRSTNPAELAFHEDDVNSCWSCENALKRLLSA